MLSILTNSPSTPNFIGVANDDIFLEARCLSWDYMSYYLSTYEDLTISDTKRWHELREDLLRFPQLAAALDDDFLVVWSALLFFILAYRALDYDIFEE